MRRKLDGEYCQIHIDLSKGKDCTQIFSKGGKDSTRDRSKLHDAIGDSLQIGKPTCPITKGSILEGELAVYSSKEHRILNFHKIRKHIFRSGTFIGTAQDSQAHSWEHLMIVYYDVHVLDDTSLLSVKIQRGSKSSRKSLRSSQATRPWSNGFLSTVTGVQPNRTYAVLLPSVSRPRERGLSSSQMTPTSTLTACEDPIDAVPSS